VAVRELCKKLGVLCRVVHIPPGLIAEAARSRRIGIEAAARVFRHAAWNREASRIGAVRVLVAHTRDDLLETLLMHFLRGAGPAGLAAMPRSRGRILRPILKLNRFQVLAYLEERGIPFRTDSTNADSAFLRNRIRNRLVPFLDELFPGWRSSLVSLGETQRFTAEFLSSEAERCIPWEVVSDPESRTAYRVTRQVFFSLPKILREEGVFLAANRLGGGQPRRKSVRCFIRGGCRAVELGGLRLEAAGDWIIASPQKSGLGEKGFSEKGFSVLLKEPGIYKLKAYPLSLRCLLAEGKSHVGTGGSFQAGLPLVLRPSQPDDMIDGVRCKALARSRLSEYIGSITAEDLLGVAAFIGTRQGRAVVVADRHGSSSGCERALFSFVVN
jgi:tRNA(Ile)-lysidine synthase